MDQISSYINNDFPADSESIEKIIPEFGLAIPKICLPTEKVNLSFWPVIACDQFTSQPEYWQETAGIVGSAPSTYALVLPELYLEDPADIPVRERISQINKSMKEYLASELLAEYPAGCILVDRSTPLHASRKGLVIAVDLEQYDFTPGNKKLIRATEGTVIERIPPRQEIRRDAELELPHVQLLIDDPDKTVIEPLFEEFSIHNPLYDVDLMQGGGHIRGWFIPAEHQILDKSIQALGSLGTFLRDGLMFAVGDGNHSLATAQAHWFEIRNSAEKNHPARFALVELINIHDSGLEFEPIHRALFDVDSRVFFAAAGQWINEQKIKLTAAEEKFSIHNLPVIAGGKTIHIELPVRADSLVAAALQEMLDQVIINWQNSGIKARIDYIHGIETVRNLAEQGAIGIILPEFSKNSFFATLEKCGILPRKTFSMGEAFEKRYYFECRRIKQAGA
jgi:hypothetical protein